MNMQELKDYAKNNNTKEAIYIQARLEHIARLYEDLSNVYEEIKQEKKKDSEEIVFIRQLIKENQDDLLLFEGLVKDISKEALRDSGKYKILVDIKDIINFCMERNNNLKIIEQKLLIKQKTITGIK